MALVDFKTSGYRSILNLWLKLKPINVIVGPNGCGKSNLYRAMYLLACAANGRLSRSICEEGGIDSVMWAGDQLGKRRYKDAPDVELSVRVGDYEYNLVFGYMTKTFINRGPFQRDPQVKAEDVFLFKNGQRVQLLKRRLGFVEAKDSKGNRIDYTMQVPESESVLSALRDPLKFPELYMLRQEFTDWRFYHDFRTDAHSPLRRPQLCVMTPIMNHDGSDLAPALATIQLERGGELEAAVEDAFPGSEVILAPNPGGTLKLQMRFPDFEKPFEAFELSDGTLQYLCLLAALLSSKPPSLLALNEPETSIHPNLYEPLARLIVEASHESQIWITTHSRELADYILDMSGYEPLELKKTNGVTGLVGVGLGGYKETDEDEDEQTFDDVSQENDE